MEIKIECPWCNQHYSVDDSLIGQKVECTACEKEFIVRTPNASASKTTNKKTNHSITQEKRRNVVDVCKQYAKKIPSNNQKSTAARSTIIIPAVIAIGLIAFGITVYIKGRPEREYKRGINAYDEQRYEDAFVYFEKAAEQGYEKAKTEYKKKLEDIFNKGKEAYIVQHQFEDAVKYLQIAAEHGHDKAQLLLGTCYFNGDGVKRDTDEAVKWFRRSAEQNNPEGQCKLGLCYLLGVGVSRREDEAVYWLEKAAEQGSEIAMKQLRDCYWEGIGVEKNFEEGKKWSDKLGKLYSEKLRNSTY